MAPIKVTAIIPTLNGAKTLGKLLAKLNEQDYPPAEIIVIDSGSADLTTTLARKEGARLLEIGPHSFDHGATRNFAAAHAEGEILLFMTQDALPLNNSLITNLVQPFQDSNIAITYARQIAAAHASVGEQFLRRANYPPTSVNKSKNDIPILGIKTFHCSNACAAYRLSTFNQLGGFNEPVVCNEDMLFAARAIRAGYKISYRSDAIVEHTHNNTFVDLFKRYFDIGASLDHDTEIIKTGNPETHGLQFAKNQLAFLREISGLKHVPLIALETASRYLGYRAGRMNRLIPSGLCKNLGRNRLYWSNVAVKGQNRGEKH
jgi:rhamnosyltransferase